MKIFIPLFLAGAMAYSSATFAEEISQKDGIKTGAETLVNGTALLGMSGAISESQHDPDYVGRKAGARTWTELEDMQRDAKPGIAEFGK